MNNPTEQTHFCPCCGQPLEVYQPLRAIMAECRNGTCPRQYITDELHIVLALTDQDVSYLTSGVKVKYAESVARFG